MGSKYKCCCNNEVTDPENNVAYAFHYYAGSHCISGQSLGAPIAKAKMQ